MCLFIRMDGIRWRQRRVEKQWGRPKAAERLGISPNYLRNIENGHAQPGLDLQLRAASVYGRSRRWLMSGSGEGVPDEPPSKDQEPERNTGPGRDGSGGTKPGGGGGTRPRRAQESAA